MKGTAARIRLLASVFAVITGAVLLHLWFLMVEQHDTWLLRSYRNRWTFRDVPTHRGTISDRFGTVLAHDVPTFELSVNYERFRRLHPVGAAVHGANLLAEHDPDRAGVRFSYAPGPLGAEIACAELLGLPLARLRPGAGDAAFGRELRFYAASLLSGCSGRSRGRVVRELTQALAAGTALVVGQALPECSSEQLAAAFERCVHQLDAFDGALQSGQGRGHLLQRLDRLRAEWYELPPERRRARLVRIADRVPFDVAAALRTAEDDQPGLVLEPAVVRERAGIRPDGSVVDVLLGGVGVLERGNTPVAEAVAERLLDDDRLQELVPELALPDEVRVEYRERARDYLAALLRQNGRSGSGGIELTQDAVLSGEIGLRLVERDKRAREQRLWSCLQVAPGHDVQLTIDLSLQRVVEDVAELTYDQWLDSGKVDSIGRDKLEVAVALIDVWTGDVLALGGQPLRIDGQLRGQPPGLSWRSSGDLGSVAKPFMLLEQFAATRLLRPHKELAEFQQCLKFYKKVAGRTLQCMHAHGELGRDPVQAIAESCNTFFFQVAEGLEQDGVQRALRRVGLVPPEAGVDEFAAGTWQPRPPELTEGMAPAPRLRGTAPVQMRGIGYDEQASPLAVARAYAALCSGFLPALALTRGPAREGVPLDVLPAELETVRTGLRECVLHGSASPAKVPGLQRHGVLGKTGTAEVSKRGDNNAWFAGYLAQPSLGGVQLAFAAVVYHVPDKYYGGVVAGQFLCAILDRIAADPLLAHRYLDPEAPR